MKRLGIIEIPNALDSEFDHAAFDPKTRRVFIAHTARNCIEVIDHDAGKHVATLARFPGVAGAVADDGEILATNRGGQASPGWMPRPTKPGPSSNAGCGRMAPRSSSVPVSESRPALVTTATGRHCMPSI
jgi:hypothetical protein